MKQLESGQNLKTVTRLPEPKLAKSWPIRAVFIILACLCLILGTVGIVVPGLPTFDFYFLAAIFASKGSKRLHNWIVNNKVIAPILQQWQNRRTLPLKVKIFSLLSMTAAACLLIWTVPHPWAVGVIVILMILVQLWMWLKA